MSDIHVDYLLNADAHCCTICSMHGFWSNEIVYEPVVMKRMHSLYEESDTVEAVA